MGELVHWEQLNLVEFTEDNQIALIREIIERGKIYLSENNFEEFRTLLDITFDIFYPFLTYVDLNDYVLKLLDLFAKLNIDTNTKIDILEIYSGVSQCELRQKLSWLLDIKIASLYIQTDLFEMALSKLLIVELEIEESSGSRYVLSFATMYMSKAYLAIGNISKAVECLGKAKNCSVGIQENNRIHDLLTLELGIQALAVDVAFLDSLLLFIRCLDNLRTRDEDAAKLAFTYILLIKILIDVGWEIEILTSQPENAMFDGPIIEALKRIALVSVRDIMRFFEVVDENEEILSDDSLIWGTLNAVRLRHS